MPRLGSYLNKFLMDALSTKKYQNLFYLEESDDTFCLRCPRKDSKEYCHENVQIFMDWDARRNYEFNYTDSRQRLESALKRSAYLKVVSSKKDTYCFKFINDQGDSMLEAIRYNEDGLEVLDQLLLPKITKYQKVDNVEQGWEVIKSMKVRGAPAISIVGALSLAIELKPMTFATKHDLHNYIKQQLEYLITSRPTAVNLQRVSDSLISHSSTLLADQEISVEEMKSRIIGKAESLLEADISVNKSIGAYGGKHIVANSKEPFVLLTHCNTGSLATAGYGTALGVIRWLHQQGKLQHVYCTETRPYNQGARLTAYELVHDKIPATLICDNMVAALMQSGKVSAVVVGADRVVANGDTANKIGTYQIAVCAKYHNVPFYVACPTSTLDMSLDNGSNILIEERPHAEMTSIGSVPIAAEGIGCWNPAFDVTPTRLITGGIITEYGVFPANSLREHNLIKSVI